MSKMKIGKYIGFLILPFCRLACTIFLWSYFL